MQTIQVKSTPLTQKHLALKAKMSAFAGYNMPISYAGIKEEHICVRTNVGVFDVSHMGEFIVKGMDALALVQRVTSNDASKLVAGGIQYACLPNGKGGIVDDLLVYRLADDMCAAGEQAFMLVVNASNIEKDWSWIMSHAADFEVTMQDISEKTGLLALQGPNATKVLEKLTSVKIGDLKYYTFAKGKVAGLDNVLISATGYTGAGGYELYARNSQMEKLWDALFEAGREFNIQPIGLGARDTLRLEKGYCLYGNDIDDTTSPIEAGLGWITKLKKGDFINADLFRNQVKNGVAKKLVGFELSDRRVPRHDHLIENEAGEVIGKVTSGTQSPTLNKPIGMGYVSTNYTAVGSHIWIQMGGGKRFAAKVVKLPFLN
jgi:aminomethyltransferase